MTCLADFLDTPETVAEYLTQVLADGDADEVVRALGHIARAKGMTEIARYSGLGRESLYKATTPRAKPRFDSVARLVRVAGLRLKVEAANRRFEDHG